VPNGKLNTAGENPASHRRDGTGGEPDDHLWMVAKEAGVSILPFTTAIQTWQKRVRVSAGIARGNDSKIQLARRLGAIKEEKANGRGSWRTGRS